VREYLAIVKKEKTNKPGNGPIAQAIFMSAFAYVVLPLIAYQKPEIKWKHYST